MVQHYSLGPSKRGFPWGLLFCVQRCSWGKAIAVACVPIDMPCEWATDIPPPYPSLRRRVFGPNSRKIFSRWCAHARSFVIYVCAVCTVYTFCFITSWMFSPCPQEKATHLQTVRKEHDKSLANVAKSLPLFYCLKEMIGKYYPCFLILKIPGIINFFFLPPGKLETSDFLQ